MSKRIPLSQYKKKPSVLKQVTINERVVDDQGNVFQATGGATPGTSTSSGGILVPGAISGGKAGTPYENKMKELFKGGASIDELVNKGHGTKEGLTKLLEGIEQKPNRTTTPGTSNIEYKPVMKETKGDQVDVYSSYEMRQQNRALKSSARQVGKAKKKLDRMIKRGVSQEQIDAQKDVLKGAQDGLNAIKQQAQLRKNRALSQTYQYRDPSKGLSEATEVQLKNTSGNLRTKSDVEGQLESIKSSTGDSTSCEYTSNILSSNDKPKTQTTSYSTVASNAMSKGFSTPLTKKYGAVSMLKKKGCKMGGFGSKTYKK